MGVSWKLVSVHSTGKHCILNGEHHDKQLDIHLRMIMMTSRELLMRAFRGTFNHVVFLYTVYGYPRIGLLTGQKSYSSGLMAIPQEMAMSSSFWRHMTKSWWPTLPIPNCRIYGTKWWIQPHNWCPKKWGYPISGMIFQVACETPWVAFWWMFEKAHWSNLYGMQNAREEDNSSSVCTCIYIYKYIYV